MEFPFVKQARECSNLVKSDRLIVDTTQLVKAVEKMIILVFGQKNRIIKSSIDYKKGIG